MFRKFSNLLALAVMIALTGNVSVAPGAEAKQEAPKSVSEYNWEKEIRAQRIWAMPDKPFNSIPVPVHPGEQVKITAKFSKKSDDYKRSVELSVHDVVTDDGVNVVRWHKNLPDKCWTEELKLPIPADEGKKNEHKCAVGKPYEWVSPKNDTPLTQVLLVHVESFGLRAAMADPNNEKKDLVYFILLDDGFSSKLLQVKFKDEYLIAPGHKAIDEEQCLLIWIKYVKDGQ